MRLPKLFEDTHREMVSRNLRVLEVPSLLSRARYFRHPDDVTAILTKDDVLFGKSARVAQSKEWLGNGIFSELDADLHAAARATLNPAFRTSYLKQLDGMMLAAAQQLADLLAVSAAGTAGAQALDMQHLFRLLTLDTIGLTSLNKSFAAMQLWQQRQQQHGNGRGSSSSSSSSNGSGGDGVVTPQLDLNQLQWDLEGAFLLQSLQLPVPRSWLPGWSKYINAAQQLDACIFDILAQLRAEQQQEQQQQQQQQTVSSKPGTSSSSSSSSSSTSGSSRQTLASFLLAAQREQGREQLSDETICFELKTVLFGGTDTSSFTLAMCAYHLAQQPDAAKRAAAEVLGLLQGSGRSDVSQLTAGDVNKLPFVTACINETMRLAPAGPVITRTALQDSEVGGYHIPKGLTVCANVYAMQRHPSIWPHPDEWQPTRWIPDEAAAAGLTMTSISESSSSSSSSQAFLPFSLGPRSCIGRNYAMLQMVLALAVLLGRGIRFAPAPGTPAPSLVKGMTMHAEQGIWLTPLTV